MHHSSARCFISFLAVLSAITAISATPPAGRNWQLEWADEFEGSFSTSFWHYWNNNQGRNNVTLSGERCIAIENGCAVIRVLQSGGVTYGAGLETTTRYGAGYYEARISIGTGWNTFWVQAINGCTISEGTEMDIVENCRGSNSIWHADNYGSSYSAPCYGYVTHSLSANTTDFHVYGLKWDDNTGATFYYNDVADWNLPTTKSASYTGAVRLTSEQATLGSVMKIDYVRYYKDMGPSTSATMPSAKTKSVQLLESTARWYDFQGRVIDAAAASGLHSLKISTMNSRATRFAYPAVAVDKNGIAQKALIGR